jgi:alpha-1,2-glucosyltransferase
METVGRSKLRGSGRFKLGELSAPKLHTGSLPIPVCSCLAMPNQPLAIIFIIPFLYLTWLYQVNKTVPEPYLDEVFHARQAQAYCAGKFRAWDPKITTPPGLYILSYVSLKTTQLIFHGGDCYLADLRWTNSLVATFVIPSQAWNLHQQLGLSRRDGQYDKNPVHTVLNICHFPLLFFFSGLYYTDVCSVSFVLGAYQYHIRSLPEAPASRTTDVFKMFGLGFCALLMRQTNIFWVAIFFAGIHAVHHVKRVNRPKLDRSIGSLDVLEAIYDPLVSEAYIEGDTSSQADELKLTSKPKTMSKLPSP